MGAPYDFEMKSTSEVHLVGVESSTSVAMEPAGPGGIDVPPGPGILRPMFSDPVPAPRARTVRLVVDVPADDDWVLPEEDMPESNPHRGDVRELEQLLLAFAARSGRGALVVANLACCWDRERPQIGVDPDVALLDPAPPEGAAIESLRTWEPGHVPPRFALEVVSSTNSTKDYEDAPAKYALLGTRELVVFDPRLFGPTVHGGPHLLQIWRRDEAAHAMVRVHAGGGPAWSEELGAWLVVTPDGQLRFSDDPGGSRLWLTAAEGEAAARREEATARMRAEGALLDTLRAAVADLCEVLGVPLDEARRAQLAALDVAGLEALRAHIKVARGWPG